MRCAAKNKVNVCTISNASNDEDTPIPRLYLSFSVCVGVFFFGLCRRMAWKLEILRFWVRRYEYIILCFSAFSSATIPIAAFRLILYTFFCVYTRQTFSISIYTVDFFYLPASRRLFFAIFFSLSVTTNQFVILFFCTAV